MVVPWFPQTTPREAGKGRRIRDAYGNTGQPTISIQLLANATVHV
jgi:hypothetical protein